MAVLKVANIHFNAAATNRLEFDGNNVVSVVANGAAKLPIGTTAERPIATPGLIRYNSTTGTFEGYNASAWGAIGGVVDLSGPFDRANLAYTYAANTAHLAANSAYAAANSTWTYAANTVMLAANSAYAKANAANIIADNAYAAANLKANIASPIFTGTPEAPLAANGNSSNIIASTRFVQNEFGRRLGKQTVWVPYSALSADSANSGTSYSGSTRLGHLSFSSSTLEDAYFTIGLPKSANTSNITFQAYWMHTNTNTSFDVVWQAFGLSLSDGQLANNGSYISLGTVTDTGGSANILYISAESSGGNIVANTGDFVNFIIRRDPTNVSDTLNVDARLLGVKILYTTNEWNDN